MEDKPVTRKEFDDFSKWVSGHIIRFDARIKELEKRAGIKSSP